MECLKKDNTLQLKNSVIIREFDISNGLKTSRLEFIPDGRNLVDPKHRNGLHSDIIEESSPCRESMIEIDGKVVNLGLENDFSVTNHEIIKGDDSDLTLKVTLSDNDGLIITMFYQIYEDMPFIVKWLELENNTKKTVTVTGCQPEVLTMPADGGLRWHECDRKVYSLSHVNNSPRRPFRYVDYNYSPAGNQAMIWVDNLTSRPEKFGFGFVNNYVRISFPENFEERNAGVKKPELPGMMCSCGNKKPGEVISQFPVGPDARIVPGEKFESFKSYMFFFEGVYEDGSLALRRMIKRLCPWTRESFTMFKHQYWPESVSKKIRETGEFDMTPLKTAIDQAAEVGFDYWYFELSLWAQSFGEYLTRPEFPEGVKDMRKVSDYAHSKGLKVGVHSPEDYIVDFPDHYLWSEEENKLVNRDLGVPGDFIKRHPEYILRNQKGKQARGWCACGASGFHEHLLETKIPFGKAIGTDMFDNDGCYYGDMCYAENHAHSSPEESQYLNWKLSVARYKAYWDAGFEVIAPNGPSSLFNGNMGNPTFGSETCTRYDTYEYVELLRTWIYKSTFSTPATSMFYMLKVDPAVMNGVDITKDSRLFDYYAASLACSGVSLKMSGMDVYHNEETRKTITKWLTFMKEHRQILKGELLHLAEPEPDSIDALMHIAPGEKTCGMLVAFNSSDKLTLERQFVVKSDYLGAKSIQIHNVFEPEEAIGLCAKDNRFIFKTKVAPKGFTVLKAELRS